MKSLPATKKCHPRHPTPPPPVNRTRSRPSQGTDFETLIEMEGGLDRSWRMLLGRIARGERIRGHAL
jgi:hypothetical protein